MDDEFGADELPSFNWSEWIEEYRWRILMGLVGLFLLGIGVRILQSGGQILGSENDENRVEILPAENSASDSGKLVVDVGGAVRRSGVYELSYDSRIGDAIVAAGGLTEDADQEWLSRKVNKAEKLKDGEKVYILSVEEAKDENLTLDQAPVLGIQTTSTVSINSANLAELEELWGIGPVTAQAIIDGRPYQSVERS